MVYSYTCMLHGIPDTRHLLVCIKCTISGHLNSAAQNGRVPRAVLPRGESIQNCVNCLIHLLYKRYTQDEFNSLINIPRLKDLVPKSAQLQNLLKLCIMKVKHVFHWFMNPTSLLTIATVKLSRDHLNVTNNLT